MRRRISALISCPCRSICRHSARQASPGLGSIPGIASHRADSSDPPAQPVDELSSSLARRGPGALGATKSLLNRLDGSLDRDIARRAADVSARILASDEAQRALRARFGTD